MNRITRILVLVVLIILSFSNSQAIGYTSGVTDLGDQPGSVNLYPDYYADHPMGGVGGRLDTFDVDKDRLYLGQA